MIPSEGAVKVDGGAKDVDHGLVIDLLGEIAGFLEVALEELKLIVKAELLLNGVACTVKELAGIVAGLLIVCVFFVVFGFYLCRVLNISISSKWYGSF